MALTTKGFGVLTVSDDPLNLAPTNSYTDLTLGSNVDFFDVNEGVAVTVTADGKYALIQVDIPENLGQVIFPNGTIVPATRAQIVPLAGGGYKTAYPISSP